MVYNLYNTTIGIMDTIIEIPELDKISRIKWYEPTIYTSAQLKEIDTLYKEEVWITKERKQHRVKEMTTSHIQNCIKCWEGKGLSKIPKGYLGGKDKWLTIFNKELESRNLHKQVLNN